MVPIRRHYGPRYRPANPATLAQDRPRYLLPNATVFLNRARKQSPEDVETLVNLGATYLELGVLAEAQGLLKRALRLEPACAPCLLNLALVADRREEKRQAIFLYRHRGGICRQEHADKQARQCSGHCRRGDGELGRRYPDLHGGRHSGQRRAGGCPEIAGQWQRGGNLFRQDSGKQFNRYKNFGHRPP